jgi:hypothetical protein
MAEKPKRKTKSKLTDKAQSERFKETARKLGVENNENFEQIVRKIAPVKRATDERG